MRWNESTFDVRLTTDNTTVTRRNGTVYSAPIQIGTSNLKSGN